MNLGHVNALIWPQRKVQRLVVKEPQLKINHVEVCPVQMPNLMVHTLGVEEMYHNWKLDTLHKMLKMLLLFTDPKYMLQYNPQFDLLAIAWYF